MVFIFIYLMSYIMFVYDYYFKYLFYVFLFNLVDFENIFVRKGKIFLGWV